MKRKLGPATNSNGSPQRAYQSGRYTFYFAFSCVVVGLNLLTLFMPIGFTLSARHWPWYDFTQGLLAYLLLPSVYGLLFALPARWRARMRIGKGNTVFVLGAVVGLVTTIVLREVFIGLTITCSGSCEASHSKVNLVFVASLIPAVVLPLMLAYYRWPKEHSPPSSTSK